MGGNVPDFRGYFLRGGGGNSASLGVQQGDAIRNIQGSFHARKYYSSGNPIIYTGSEGGNVNDNLFTRGINNDSLRNTNLGGGTGAATTHTIIFNASNVVPTANENRPVNKAVRYLIRAKS